MSNPNINCLQGMSCPKCKSFGPFSICGTATFVVTDDGTDEYSSVEWYDTSHCRCLDCNFRGRVGEFREKEGKKL
jgi:hypothetical protein